MIAGILLMYCMGTAQIALVLYAGLIAFFDQHAIEGSLTIFDDQGNRIVWIPVMLQLSNVSSGVCLGFEVPEVALVLNKLS